MFDYSNSVSGNIDIKNLWNLYSDTTQWKNWDVDIKDVKLSGIFTTGSSGVIHMKNGQDLPFVIESCIENTEFKTVSQLGEIKVCFFHTIKQNEIIHRVTVEGKGVDEEKLMGIGKGITSSLPATMEKLLSMVLQ